MRNLKPLSLFVFFLPLACERISIKTHRIENRWYRTGKYMVCRRVPASFSPEILQAGAVKGLKDSMLTPSILSISVTLRLKKIPQHEKNKTKKTKTKKQMIFFSSLMHPGVVNLVLCETTYYCNTNHKTRSAKVVMAKAQELLISYTI